MDKYHKDLLIVFSLGAFVANVFTHGGPSAYPPNRSCAIFPSSIYRDFVRVVKSLDRYMYGAEPVRQHALAERGGDRL